jgi:hypothetical protein
MACCDALRCTKCTKYGFVIETVMINPKIITIAIVIAIEMLNLTAIMSIYVNLDWFVTKISYHDQIVIKL